MIYLKSVFAGVVAIAVSFFVLSVGVGIYLWIAARKLNPLGAVAWDPISITSPGFLLSIFAIFVAGFLWEFRRASR